MNFAEKLTKDGLVIFLFHGVIEKSGYIVRNYTKKHLEKDYFVEVLKNVKKSGYALSMDEVVELYKSNKIFPPRAFAITFDDGFENNYSIAAPILKDLGLPATFYLTTDFIENNHMSWIDRIEYCLEEKNEGKLRFPWINEEYLFKCSKEKIVILDYLRNYVKRDKSIHLEDLASNIFFQCGIDEIYKSEEQIDLKMNWKQVKELKEDENFIIGGHSHHHLNLAFLTQSELEKEIKTSLEFIEQNASSTRHFSYPEGLEYCYSDKVIKVLKNNGIECCPIAIAGINKIGDSLFHLKRVLVV